MSQNSKLGVSILPSFPFFPFSGKPHALKPAIEVLGSDVSSPEGPGRARPSSDFGGFWGENRPLTDGDSGLEEV